MHAKLTRTVAALDTTSPFLGGKALERRRGRPYRARLGANECLFGISPAAKRILMSACDEAALYTDPTHFELREAISQRWGRPSSHIGVAEGIDSLIGLIVRAFVEPGDPVVTLRGAYPTFDYHVRGYGGKILFERYLEDGGIDLDVLLARIRSSGAKLVFLANPDNPTGTLTSAADIAYFLRRLPSSCILLLDEAYAEFAAENSFLPREAMQPNLVRLRTFSKAYGLAGIRVGYIVADPLIVTTLDRIRLHFGVSKLSQEMALAAYGDDAFLAEIVDQTARGRAHYRDIARSLGLATLPSPANFVTFDFGDAVRAKAMAEWLEESDVFIRRPTDAPLDRFIRVTVGTIEARDYFAKSLAAGMKRIGSTEAVGEISMG